MVDTSRVEQQLRTYVIAIIVSKSKGLLISIIVIDMFDHKYS